MGARIHDDDLLFHDDVAIAAPARVDLHEGRRHGREPHARRDRGADRDREVRMGKARAAAGLEHGLADAGLLLRRDVDVDVRRVVGRGGAAGRGRA